MSYICRYSAISTINHWVTALLVTAMLVLGFTASASSEEIVEDYIMSIHIGLGFFVMLFVTWRILFRLYEGFPQSMAESLLERRLAYLVHRILLILLFVQVITGPLYLFTEGECIQVFGWFSVCLPLERLSAIHEFMEQLHVITGLYILPAILILHFMGAIRHYLTKPCQQVPSDM